MTVPVLSSMELLAWCEENTAHWFQFFEQNPEALTLPCGIYSTENVLGLIHHIVVVELRHRQRLCGEPIATYEDVPHSLPALIQLHEQTMQAFRQLIQDQTQNWSQVFEFQTRTAGTLRASRRKLLFHVLMHSTRHWAQLATLMRQHGLPASWQADLLLSSALD